MAVTTPSRPEFAKSYPELQAFVQRLIDVVGPQLESVLLYGSAARGDFAENASDLNVIVVTNDLGPETLEKLSKPILEWERRQPGPRLFTRQMLADAADVFPIELLEILRQRVVLHGPDPLVDVVVRPQLLRVQCERELREKMMRLREAYIDSFSNARQLKGLLINSYTTFLAVFRGCLNLLGEASPIRNQDVLEKFCKFADLDRSPFDEVDRLRSGEFVGDLRGLFGRYYRELQKAEQRIDVFTTPGAEPEQSRI
jgi:predicted nucleotidyltransferase